MILKAIIPGESYKATAYLGKGMTEQQAFENLSKEVKRERADLVYTHKKKRTNPDTKKTKLTLYYKTGNRGLNTQQNEKNNITFRR